MTGDAEKYRLLTRFCQALPRGEDVPSLFLHAADIFHELTRCRRAVLVLPSDSLLRHAGFALEFPGPRHCTDLPAERHGSETIRWVLEHRQPRVGVGDEVATLYLPLVCRRDVIGVLGLTGESEEQLGAWDRDFLQELAGLLALALDGLGARARVAELQRFQRESAYLRDEIKTDRDLRLLTGESGAMKAVRLAIQQVAATDCTVLILGETGTGKELVARAIHQSTLR